MSVAYIDALHLVNNRLDELREASRHASSIVSALASELDREGGGLPQRMARAARAAAARPWMRRVTRLEAITPEPRVLKRLLMQMSIIMHLASLATGSREARLASIYLYAGSKLVETVEPEESGAEEKLLCYIDAGRLLLQGRERQALQQLGSCLREALPVKAPGEEGWAEALTLSHLLDVAPYTTGRLLEAWKYYNALDEATGYTGDTEDTH